MWGRWFLIGLLHVGSCLACMYFKLRIYDPDATASQALSVVLAALGALPFGWLIALAGGSPSTQFGLFIVNSFLWAAGIEWLLQRFVDRRNNPIAK